ncbi:IS1 transposase [Moraxella bovis]|uniref:IS1 transposase n=1 Tax=Moraxella bovis TaxID=476 RepID=A0A378PQ88_MORBO|nr:IS1 transposase [Moraxella bovis]
MSFNKIACDDWDSFLVAFKHSIKQVGKRFTVGIEGNNTRLRTFARRAFRKTCCFSKNLTNHLKAFDLVLHYINHGWGRWGSMLFGLLESFLKLLTSC